MNSVKETLEVLDVLKVLAECYAEAKKDGHVNWMDVPKFTPAISSLSKAVEGAEKIEAELKDLDMSEVLAVVAKIREIATVLKGK